MIKTQILGHYILLWKMSIYNNILFLDKPSKYLPALLCYTEKHWYGILLEMDNLYMTTSPIAVTSPWLPVWAPSCFLLAPHLYHSPASGWQVPWEAERRGGGLCSPHTRGKQNSLWLYQTTIGYNETRMSEKISRVWMKVYFSSCVYRILQLTGLVFFSNSEWIF